MRPQEFRRHTEQKRKARIKRLIKTQSLNQVLDPYRLNDKRLDQYRGLWLKAIKENDPVNERKYQNLYDSLYRKLYHGKDDSLGYIQKSTYRRPKVVKKQTSRKIRSQYNEKFKDFEKGSDPEFFSNANKDKKIVDYAWEID